MARLQRSAGNQAVGRMLNSGIERNPGESSQTLPGKGGQPIAPGLRTEMESRFQQDFSPVRLHVGPQAEESAKAVKAKAYTLGGDIVFGENRYAPGTSEGKRLLAHELAHVVQQSRGRIAGNSHSEGELETFARHAALNAPGNDQSVRVDGSSRVRIAREVDDDAPKNQPGPSITPPTHQLESGITPTSHQLPPAITASSVVNDPATLARLTALAKQTKGKKNDPENVKGKIVEAMMNREVQRRMQTGSGLNDLLPTDAAKSKIKFVTAPKDLSDLQQGEAAFIEGDRIRGMVGKRKVELSDGMILLREGQSFRVLTVFESKAGERRASDLHRTESGREDPTIEERKESQKFKAEEATEFARRQKLDPKATADKITESELGGQIRKDVERLSPNLETDHAEILVDGKPVPVRSSPGTTRFVGVVPHDLDTKGTVAKLKNSPKDKKAPGEGLNFTMMTVSSSEKEIAEEAKKIAGGETKKTPAPKVQAKAKASKKPPSSDKSAAPGTGAGGGTKKTASASKSTKSTSPKKKTGKAAAQAAKSQGGETKTKKPAAKSAKPKVSKAKPAKVAKPAKQATPAKQAKAPKQTTPPKQAKPLTQTSSPAQSKPPAPVVQAPKVEVPDPTKIPVPGPKAPPKPKLAPPVQAKPPIVIPASGVQAAKPQPKPAAPGAPPAKVDQPKADVGNAGIGAGKTDSRAFAPGSDPARTNDRTVQTHGGASLIAGPGQAGASGSAGIGASQEHGHGLSTSQSVDFGGKVLTNVEEIPNTSPRRYRVTVSIDLSAGAEVGASRKEEGKTGGSLTGSVSGSLTLSRTHEMTSEQKETYLNAVRTGGGGAAEELKVAQMVASGHVSEARDFLAHLGSAKNGAEEAKRMKEGDVETVSAGESVSAKGGISKSQFGAEFGISRSGQLTRTKAARGGKVLLTVAVRNEKGTTVGGSFSEGVAGMGVSSEDAQSKGKSVTFVLDPKDPNFNALYNQVMATDTVDDLGKLAAARPELAGSTTTSKGTSSTRTTSASVLGVGLSIKQGGALSEEETKDARGTSHKYTGSNTLGGSLSVAGKTVAGSETKDEFQAEVGPDNKGSGETTSTHSEIDVGSSVNKLEKSFEKSPIGTVGGLLTGNTKVLQQKTEVEGKKLTDDSFTRLAELAKDERAWGQSWHGNVSAYIDWQKTRHRVLAADGDRAMISKALAEFESGDSGRSKTVENAVSDTGIAFDFPDELSDQRPIYDELVAGDPLAHVRDLEADGNKTEALADVTANQEKLTHLQDAIRSHQASVNPAALAEMLRRVSARRAELRAESRKLSPSRVAQPAPASEVEPIKVKDQGAAEAEGEALAKQDERKTRASELASDMRSNREKEQANFAEIQKEIDKEQSWFSKPDIIRISNLLNDLLPMYKEWDKSVEELKGILQESGVGPDQANQYAPNRAKWNAIHSKEFPW